MPGKIFISYRREDSRADARSIEQHLRSRFGSDSVFLDVDTIKKGSDFRKALTRSLEQSAILLAVIGPNWLSIVDANGNRRIDEAGDFVRLEIASALKRDIPVIPVLVSGARMPADFALPEDVRGLVYRQAAVVTHENFSHDMAAIENDIEGVLGSTPSKPGKTHRYVSAGVAAIAIAGAAVLALPLLAPHLELPWRQLPETASQPSIDGIERIAAERAKAEAEAARLATVEAESRAKAKVAAAATELKEREEKLRAHAAETSRATALAALEAAAERAKARLAHELELKRLAPAEAEALRNARAERPGQVRAVWGWPDVDNDCNVLGLPRLEVLSPPRYGRLLFVTEEVTFTYTRIAAREKCIGMKMPGRRAYYVFEPATPERPDRETFVVRQIATQVAGSWEFEVDFAKRAVRMKILTAN